MEDRFKFRIPMFSDKGNFCEFQYLELGDWIECSLAGSNGEPEQCTGWLDKNSKLIYEGDIVKAKNTKGNICNFRVDFDHCGAFFGLSSFLSVSPLIGTDTEEEIEVIGNIHQNKDLLNA